MAKVQFFFKVSHSFLLFWQFLEKEHHAVDNVFKNRFSTPNRSTQSRFATPTAVHIHQHTPPDLKVRLIVSSRKTLPALEKKSPSPTLFCHSFVQVYSTETQFFYPRPCHYYIYFAGVKHPVTVSIPLDSSTALHNRETL